MDKRLPIIVTVLAIVLLTHSLASLTWKLVPVPETEGITSGIARPQIAPTSRSTNQPLANKISQWHLFGKYEVQKPKPKPKLVEDAPETRLNLKLRGVFASEDKSQARAIIADAKGVDDSYAIGDEVPGGAILSDIFADKVILERNGQFETLKLPIEVAPSAVAGTSPRPSTSSRSPSSSMPPIDTATADQSEILRHYRDALLNDPQSVMGAVRVQPYNKNGKLEGYRIRPGKDRQLLNKFGLRSGDIVKSVNGVPLDNPIKALEVLRDLSSASSVTIDVERNGTPRSFTFQVQ